MNVNEQTKINVEITPQAPLNVTIGECAKILEQKNPGSSVAAELKEKAWSFIKKTCAVVASSALKTGINAIHVNDSASSSALTSFPASS